MTTPDTIPHMPSGVSEALWQMFLCGPIWDGDLVCKTSRKWLKEHGYSAQSSGFNFLTANGVDMAVSLGMDRMKEKRNA
ncbi:hypothetical protein K7H20_13980 [Salipiger manganoxidans]|uniref:hypothetical protein n=1 Tax=Salipiger marinus TaxID=555512 RepID=UPI001E32489D|nr:hypothetical protein [Salipiger manganoxidans]MCD1619175.1 hypothetical protein [Salipiger manganoxidans]